MWITKQILFPKSELYKLKKYFTVENNKAMPTESYKECLKVFIPPKYALYLEWGDNIILWEDINIIEYVYGILDDELISKILGNTEIEIAIMSEEDGNWNYWAMSDGKDLEVPDDHFFALKAYHTEEESDMKDSHPFCFDSLNFN